jgi:peptide deformylase
MRCSYRIAAYIVCAILNGGTEVMSMKDLPDYMTLDGSDEKGAQILKTLAKPLNFPLSDEDKRDVQILIDKFNQEDLCVGLAAPQVGISKKIIIINVPDDPKLKNWRPDLTDTLEKTVLINATYKPLKEEKVTAYEACFSVKKSAGPVARYETISYSGYTSEGQLIEGQASGFLARVIQHEIDHTEGTCFVDHVPQGQLITMEEYVEMRKNKMDK